MGGKTFCYDVPHVAVLLYPQFDIKVDMAVRMAIYIPDVSFIEGIIKGKDLLGLGFLLGGFRLVFLFFTGLGWISQLSSGRMQARSRSINSSMGGR